jgi:hypothetical protein
MQVWILVLSIVVLSQLISTAGLPYLMMVIPLRAYRTWWWLVPSNIISLNEQCSIGSSETPTLSRYWHSVHYLNISRCNTILLQGHCNGTKDKTYIVHKLPAVIQYHCITAGNLWTMYVLSVAPLRCPCNTIVLQPTIYGQCTSCLWHRCSVLVISLYYSRQFMDNICILTVVI